MAGRSGSSGAETQVSPIQLDEAAVRQAVAGRGLVGANDAPLELHARIGSTNDRAAELAAAGAPEGTLVVAREQDAGRGRHGRVWASPPGGLYFSLVLRPDDAMLRRLPVTLLGGLAAAEAIEEVTGLRAELKWPNDVMLDGRKVAGILGEMTRDDAGPRIVLGVGINAATPPEALGAELAGVAASLAELASGPDPAALLAAFVRHFEGHYLSVRRGGGATILAVACARMPLLGKPVRVRLTADQQVTGIASGLNATGGLVLEREDGTRTVVVAGEVEGMGPK